jgi:hypothetical protein
MLGKHFCVIDHIAGIQRQSNQDQSPYVGRIRIENPKFFIEISRDTSPAPCMNAIPTILSDGCKMKYVMTSKSAIHVVPEKAWSALIPQDFMYPSGEFSIAEGGNFWAHHRFGRDAYVYEGRCEKIN